jgi:hypothetical protein
MGQQRKLLAVGERRNCSEAGPQGYSGAVSSADADMSSDKTGEKPVRRKPKVSWGRLIRPG